MKRRHFLQVGGGLLTSLGWNALAVQHQSDRYGRAIAQSTPRKLALLVGINEYPESSLFSPLYGCVTDADLQRQLLIHRFGFNPKDIVTLTDAQATRDGILTAFEEHLIQQAKPGDVVVFHFSGHGSQVSDPDRDFPDGLNSTLVPVDSRLPANFPQEGGAVQDLMGHTLYLLMSALKTENVTAILDSCHSGGGKRGNVIVRSRAGGSVLEPSPEELAYQDQWRSRLGLSPDELIAQRRKGIAKGMVITSTRRDQLAADTPFSDFYAGAFTYTMTQYLWQQAGAEPFVSAIPNIARATTRDSFSGQEPEYEAKAGSNNEQKPFYFVPNQKPPAEAVITRVEGSQAELWLGGLDPNSLEAFGESGVLSVVDAQGNEQGLVELQGREGLVGRGRLLQAKVQPGALLRERSRGVPTDLVLRVGLDPSLGDDASAAQQALENIARVQVRPLQQGEVDYLLGRVTEAARQNWQGAGKPAIGSVGLFSQALEPVPGSFGGAGEGVEAAIQRLQAKLRSLLAARIVRTTLNTSTSRLQVSVSLSPEGSDSQLLAEVFPTRSAPRRRSASPSTGLPRLAVGTPVQFRIENRESRDLYFSVLVIDPTGDMAVIFPNQWTASDEVMQVKAGQSILIPDAGRDSFQLITQEPKGVSEALIIASSSPLRQALSALRDVATRSGQSRGPVAPEDPATVMGSLLADLGGGTRSSGGPRSPGGQLDTTQLAAMAIAFEVV